MVPPSRRKPPPPIDEEIYRAHDEELFNRAVSEGRLVNDIADVDWWWEKFMKYQDEAEKYFEGEPQRVRWHVETKLYLKIWEKDDLSGFPYLQRLPPTIAEHQELKARKANQPSHSSHPGKGTGVNRQPGTDPSRSGGDLAAGLVVGAANVLVPNETKCRCTCKCCLVRCTGAGAATTSMTSDTDVKDGRPAVGTATLPLSNQMKRSRPAGEPSKSGKAGTSGVIGTKRESPSGGGGQTVNRMATASTGNPQHGSSRSVDTVDEVNTQHFKRSFSPYGDEQCSTYTISQAPKRLRRDGFSSADRVEARDGRIGAAGFGVRPSTRSAYFDQSQGPARGVHAGDQSPGPRIKAEVKEEEEEEVKIKLEPQG